MSDLDSKLSYQPAAPLPDGPFETLEGRRFRFACHPNVACFNACCADLNLPLTPYDLLRLKHRLDLRSDALLEAHTTTEISDQARFPMIRLKMRDNPERTCPFVTPEGCAVYEDRPSACRTYPLGRGSGKGSKELFFLVKEEHCRGFEEDCDWDIGDFVKDQGLAPYYEMNDRWTEIVLADQSLGSAEQAVKKIQMFFMVSYNLDRFRDFVLGSRFLERFACEGLDAENIQTDDVALLDLGFKWLWFALYGRQTLIVKQMIDLSFLFT